MLSTCWLLFLHSAAQLIPGLLMQHSITMSCSCHNMDLVFYQIGLSFVYHPFLVTTQRIGLNALRRKEIPQINKAHLLIEMHSR